MIQKAIASHEGKKQNRETVSPKVAALRVKIHDADYLNYAIGRIAQVLSRELLEGRE